MFLVLILWKMAPKKYSTLGLIHLLMLLESMKLLSKKSIRLNTRWTVDLYCYLIFYLSQARYFSGDLLAFCRIFLGWLVRLSFFLFLGVDWGFTTTVLFIVFLSLFLELERLGNGPVLSLLYLLTARPFIIIIYSERDLLHICPWITIRYSDWRGMQPMNRLLSRTRDWPWSGITSLRKKIRQPASITSAKFHKRTRCLVIVRNGGYSAVKRAFYDKYGEEKLKEGFFAEGCMSTVI